MSVFTEGRWGLGVSKRIEYGSVVCVSPVASSCCAGIVFGGNRRLGHPGFGKVSSRRRAYAHAHYAASRRAALSLIVIIGTSRAVALGCRCRANAGAWSCRRQCQPRAGTIPAGMSHVRRLRFIRCRRRSAPLYRRQSHRPRQPVVRAFHEHGAGAVRSSRHRLGHGEFVCKLWPARIRSADRRHRRDGTARRRPCRHRQRHRCRSAIRLWCRAITATGSGKRVLARPDLRLRHADELMRHRYVNCEFAALPSQSHRRRQWCRRRSPRHRSRNRRGRRRRISACGMLRSRAAVSGSTLTAAQRTIRFTTFSRTRRWRGFGRADRTRARPASR